MRYGYRSKVRVGKAENHRTISDKKDKLEMIEREEEIIEEITTENDSIPHFDAKVDQPNRKIVFKNPRGGQHELNKPKPKSNKNQVIKEPLNKHAKWAKLLGILSLFSPYTVTMVLGPMLIYVSLKALKEIKKSNEKGLGIAKFGLITGIITTLILAGFTVFGGSLESGIALIIIGLIVNLFLYVRIVGGGFKYQYRKIRNRIYSKITPLDFITRLSLFLSFIFCLGTLTAPFLYITCGLGPITLILGIRSLVNIPKDYKVRRTLAIFCIIIGLLGTIACIWFGLQNSNDLAGAIIIGLTILVGVLSTLVGIISVLLMAKFKHRKKA